MIEIIPALMPKTLVELEDKVSLVIPEARTVQIDVMDGKFVPNKSWPYGEGEDQFRLFSEEERGLPYWEEVDYEIDLMVSTPLEDALRWIAAGASRIVVHAESISEAHLFFDTIRNQHGLFSEGNFSPALGIAFSNETILEPHLPAVAEADFVQLMGISRIGFQGESFDVRVIDRIEQLRESFPDIIISIDGAVTMETAPRLIKAGARRLVVGSAIFSQGNPKQALRDFIKTAHDLKKDFS